MRLDSLFFVALLFACFNTSSTRSISTSMGSVTPSQKDVPTHGFVRDGVETIKEERTFNEPGFDKAIEGVNSMAPGFIKEMLDWISGKSETYAEKAYKFLQLDEDNNLGLRNERYNAWIRYLAEAPPAIKSAIPKLLGRHGDESFLKMLDALEEAKVGKDLQGQLKSALITSWKDQKKPARDVFKLLKLNLKPEPNHSVDVERLRMWVQYVEKNLFMPGTQMLVVIRDYELDVRVMILGGLKQIDGTDWVVQFLQNPLLKFFQERDGLFKGQVVQVFEELNLQNNLLKNPNLDIFYSFAVKFESKMTKEASLITAARAVYGDIPLGKMLEAAWRKDNDATATPLLLELFRQWNADTKSHQLDIDNKLKGDLQTSYDAYISAFVEAI
ncbi:unnamed protein product [Peronospora farinosa]|uniref:Uncharacterized protein n=1 Tax=Peronospora farinosa TaxID=134698 RepID=A0ABN8C3M9_9STRA|nr:unnamed protein product [Peronospora farinosa]